MHPCFLIHELQLLILTKCDPSSLGILARTSKLFQENSLNQLWRHIEFNDILELLPDNLWTYKRLTRHSRFIRIWPAKVRLLRQVGPEDLVIFNKYANRVISVSWNTGSSKLHESAIEILWEHMPHPILPNLRAISGAGYYQSRDCVLIRLFLGPKVESIHLSHLPLGGYADELLSDIGSVVPSLKSLNLEYHASGSHHSQPISDLVCRLDHLEDLSVVRLSPQAITHIAASQTLRRLKFHHLVGAIIETLPSIPSPNLRHMKLTTFEGPLTFVRFLSFICPSQLQHLFLVLEFSDSQPSLDEWKQCFQLLSLHCSSTLQTLVVVDTPQRSVEEHADWAMFKPLLNMGYLKHLTLRGIYHTLDNKELEMIARSWPHLMTLDILTPYVSTVAVPRITLSGLVSLLNHCPELEILRLGIDARDVDYQLPNTCNRAITKLTVGSSPIGDSAAVANFLSKVIPSLRETKPWDMDAGAGGDYCRRWETVTEILKASKPVAHDAAV